MDVEAHLDIREDEGDLIIELPFTCRASSRMTPVLVFSALPFQTSRTVSHPNGRNFGLVAGLTELFSARQSPGGNKNQEGEASTIVHKLG